MIGATVAAVGFDYDGETTTDRAGDALLRVPADAHVRWVVARKAGAGFDYFENYRSRRHGQDRAVAAGGDSDTRRRDARYASRPSIPQAGHCPELISRPGSSRKPRKLDQVNIGGSPGMCVGTDHSGEATFDWLPPVVEEDVPFLIFPREYSCPESPVYRSGDDGKVLEAAIAAQHAHIGSRATCEWPAGRRNTDPCRRPRRNQSLLPDAHTNC